MSEFLKSLWDALFMAIVSLIIFMLMVKYFDVRENLDLSNLKLNTLEVVFLASVVLGSYADNLVKNVLSRLCK
jgi:hypothetical protein